MIDKQKILINVEKRIISLGYKIWNKPLPANFTWTPDIYAFSNKSQIAILIRVTDEIPEQLLQRMSSMNKKNMNIQIAVMFCKKPKQASLVLTRKYGIKPIIYSKEKQANVKLNTLEQKIKEKTPKNGNTGKIRKPQKMTRIDCFLSSHQVLTERTVAKEVIDQIRAAHKCPVFPVLVEHDHRYRIDQTRKCINENMDESELFISILAEEHRPDVSYEIKRAFKTFEVENIRIFLKLMKKRPSKLEALIDWIKNQENVKYIEYTDHKDFETKLQGFLMWKLARIHHKKKIPFLT